MIGLYELLPIAHCNLKTKTGNIWLEMVDKNKDENIGVQAIGDVYSRMACGFWQRDKDECIKDIANYIEGDKSDPNSIIIGLFAAWVNADIQHPKVEELARYFVKHKLPKYPLDMTGNDYIEKSKQKTPHRPKKEIIECLDTLMVYFEKRTIHAAAMSLSVDRKKVRSDLQRLVGNDTDYRKLIDVNFTCYSSIKELYEKWRLKKS
jgi:hypothetical protein